MVSGLQTHSSTHPYAYCTAAMKEGGSQQDKLEEVQMQHCVLQQKELWSS